MALGALVGQQMAVTALGVGGCLALAAAEERAVIQTHPSIAINILADSDIGPKVRDIILHHHEYYDGRGYPDGTKGDEISILCYILSTVDAFDVITSDRVGTQIELSPQALLQACGGQTADLTVSSAP